MKMCGDYMQLLKLPDHPYQTTMGFQQANPRGNEQVIYGKEPGMLGFPTQPKLFLPTDQICYS